MGLSSKVESGHWPLSSNPDPCPQQSLRPLSASWIDVLQANSNSPSFLQVQSPGAKLTEHFVWDRKLPRQGDTAKGELPAGDVGPVTRQFLTRADDFFDDLYDLTLCNKLVGRQVPERAVRAA